MHYNCDDSYLFVNGSQELKFKAKDSEIKKNTICLSNILSDWSLTNSTRTKLFGRVYDFPVDYVPISGVKTIYNIHRYLMTKHNI